MLKRGGASTYPWRMSCSTANQARLMLSVSHISTSYQQWVWEKRGASRIGPWWNLRRQPPLLLEVPWGLLALCQWILGCGRHRSQMRDPINLGLTRWRLDELVDTFVEIERNPSTKHQIQSECGEWAGWSETGRPNLSRETKFSDANGEREKCMSFSSSENEQDWQPDPVNPYSAECADHTYPDHTPSSSSTYAHLSFHEIMPSWIQVTLGKSADKHLGVSGLFIPPLCLTLDFDLLTGFSCQSEAISPSLQVTKFMPPFEILFHVADRLLKLYLRDNKL